MLLKGLEVVCCMSEVHLCVPKKNSNFSSLFCARKSDKLAMSSAHSHFHSHHLHFHIGMDYSCVTVVRPNVTHQSMTTKIFAFLLQSSRRLSPYLTRMAMAPSPPKSLAPSWGRWARTPQRLNCRTWSMRWMLTVSVHSVLSVTPDDLDLATIHSLVN